jgi:molybdopterin-binding protein
MRLSACNVLRGRVVEVTRGAKASDVMIGKD